MNRLQHLLKVEGFDGIRSINLESQCFQLDENGEIFRLVYLGVTDHELLIATQCLPNYKNVVEAAISHVDLELEGLKLISSIPLECIQFYVVDDRSRKFAVCTCLGVVQYFEVCNTPDGSDTAWLKWRELFSQRDNPLSCGYKRWRFMSSDKRCKNELEFIRRPFPFYCVESVGIQTTNETGEILETLSPNIQIKENKLQERLFKVTFPFIKTEPINCSISQNNIHLDHATPSPKRSKSCSDLVEGRPISKTVYSYLVFSLVYQNVNGDRDKAKEEFLYLFSQWAEMEKIIHYYCQIVKYQTKNKQRSLLESVDVTDSESEESITDLIDGYKQNESCEKPQVNRNWLKLKEKIHENAKSNTKTTFAKIVEEVVFKMCDSKQKRKNFTSFKPNEFAAEILLMSSKLVACISYFDFMSLYYGKMERSVEDLISFFQNLSQLISTDVLRHTFTTGILKTMIFYIKVGEVCLAMGDYQTCRSVLLGLHSPRVHILTDDWDDLQCKHKEEYRLLIELSKRVLVPRNYLEHFKNHYGEEKTRLPLLDHLLRHAWKAHLPPDRFQNMLYPALTIRARIKRRPSNSKLHRVKCSLTDLKKKVNKEKIKKDLRSEKRDIVKETTPCSSQKLNSENDEPKATSEFSSQVKIADDFSNKIIQEALEIIRNDPSNLGSTIDGAKLNEMTEDQYVSTNFKQIPEGNIVIAKEEPDSQEMKMAKKIGQYERADSKDVIKAKVGAKEKNSLSENLENQPREEESQNIKRLKGESSEIKDQVKAGEREGERKVKDDLDKKEEMKRKKEVTLADKEKKDNIYEKKKAKEETEKLKKEKEKRRKDEKEKRKNKEKEQKDEKIKEKKEKEARDKKSKEEKKLKDDEKKKKAKKNGKGKMKYEAFQKEDKIEEELEDGIRNGDGTEMEKDIEKTSMHWVSKENETEKSIPTGARNDKSQETKSDTTKKTSIRENINVENDNFDSIASTSKSSENLEDLDTRYITTRHRYSGDSGRRKSLFEEAADDENVLKIKEASIDEAVERKVKDVRRASIFDESYLDEVGEKETKVAFKSALKSPTQAANEAKSNKRMSVFGSIFSSHGDASFVSSLFSAISKSASASSLGSKGSSDSVGKRKKSVRFEDSVSIARYNINASSDANVNYNKTMNNMCELCRGKCIYNADPFKEILKSQLLAVTYINSQASRPALRRLIEERLI